MELITNIIASVLSIFWLFIDGLIVLGFLNPRLGDKFISFYNRLRLK